MKINGKLQQTGIRTRINILASLGKKGLGFDLDR